MKLKARHAISGSPSSWKVLAIMANEASEMEVSVMLSVVERDEVVAEEDMVVCRITMFGGVCTETEEMPTQAGSMNKMIIEKLQRY